MGAALESSLKRRRRQGALCLSEIMTIMVGFHLSGYRTFKYYYLNYVLRYQRCYFPGLVSYNRFVELLQGSLVPLCCFLTSRFGQCSGISFIDSTKISVCHNRRIGFEQLREQGVQLITKVRKNMKNKLLPNLKANSF